MVRTGRRVRRPKRWTRAGLGVCPRRPRSPSGHHDGPRLRRREGARPRSDFAKAFSRRGFVVLVHDHAALSAASAKDRRATTSNLGADRRWAPRDSFWRPSPSLTPTDRGCGAAAATQAAAIVLGGHRPTAARGGRPGAHHQRVSAEPAKRRPDQLTQHGGGIRRRRTQAVPGCATGTQAVVSDGPSVARQDYREPDAIESITSRCRGVGTTSSPLRCDAARRDDEPGTWGVTRVSPTPC